MDQHERLLEEFERAAAGGEKAADLMQHISDRLHAEFVRYNWVGFYLADAHDSDALVLGAHAGSFTPHVRISLSQGLCGAAAMTGKMIVVNDVKTDPRYLQGSEHTKSEIVAPIFARGRLAGAFDINSYFKDNWTAKEQSFVEQCAGLVARRL